MLRKKIFLIFIMAAIALSGFLFSVKKVEAAGARECVCYKSDNTVLPTWPDIGSSQQCNLICGGLAGIGYKYEFENNVYTSTAVPTVNNCACAERVALTLYDIKSKSNVIDNTACMDKCRSAGNEFYSFPQADYYNIGSFTILTIDTFRYASNCACSNGGNVPFIYPVSDLKQATSGQDCNNKCYASSAAYFTYDGIGALSVIAAGRNRTVAPAVTTAPTTGGTGGMKDTKIPGASIDAATGIVSCGRPGQDLCTICDLIKGINKVIQYLMKIAIGVALLAIGIGGVMYIVSAGEKGLIDQAKSTMKNAAIGFVIIFAGFLIINTTIDYIGARKDASGNLTFGMRITSWGQFECAAPTSGTR